MSDVQPPNFLGFLYLFVWKTIQQTSHIQHTRHVNITSMDASTTRQHHVYGRVNNTSVYASARVEERLASGKIGKSRKLSVNQASTKRHESKTLCGLPRLTVPFLSPELVCKKNIPKRLKKKASNV